MGSAILYPGAVTLRGATGPTPIDPATVVTGSPPQWADSSDATSATIAQSDRMDATVTTLASAGVDPSTVTAVTLHYRCSQSAASSLANAYLTDAGDPAAATIAANFELVFPTGGGVIEDFDVALTSTVADAVACLTSATPTIQFQVSSPGSGGPDLTVYEAWVVVTTSGAAVVSAPEVLRGRPLRQFPRSDGLGMSSHPRLYPPPRSAQASNRRAGGYL